MKTYPKEIFKAYDIRGIVGKTLNASIVEDIGQAIGSEAVARNIPTIVIGRDGRVSGPDLGAALARGIQKAGVNVIDVGLVATPMLYYAAYALETYSGVMVTGSHNPADYNGLKMLLGKESIAGEAIQSLLTRLETGDLATGAGSYSTQDISEAYYTRILGDVTLNRSMNVIVDAGNGVPGAYAPVLLRRLGCKVRELFCEVDGTFPNHHPDPSQPANLQDLIHALANTDAELGLAFDGDGDRLGVVTKGGDIIYPDRQLMLFAADVLARKPGAKIIYDVKSTRNLAPWIRKHGGEPVLCRTGHSYIKQKIVEVSAELAGEMSGHMFFKERWYGFDDGIYTAVRLLEILAQFDDPSAVLNALPNAVSTPELNIKMAEGEHHKLIAELSETATFTDAENIERIDGLRVEYADGFGLARGSNTTPVIVLRFEADTDAGLERIMADFRRVLHSARPDMTIPF